MRQPLSLKGRALALLAQREQSVLELRRKLTRHARTEAARRDAGAVTRSATLGSRDAPVAIDAHPALDAHRSLGAYRSLGAHLSLEPIDAIDPLDPLDAIDAIDAIDPLDPLDPVDATESTGCAERPQPVGRRTADERLDGDEPSAGVSAQVEAVIAWLREHDYLNEQRFVEGRVHARAGRFGSARIQHELSRHGLAMSGDDALALRATEAERAAQVWQRKFGQAPADRAEQARQARFLMARGFPGDVVRRLVSLRPSASPSNGDDGDDGDNPD